MHACRDNKSCRDLSSFSRHRKYPQRRRHALCWIQNSGCASYCDPSQLSLRTDDLDGSPCRYRSSCLHWDSCYKRLSSCRCCNRTSACYCLSKYCSLVALVDLACRRCFAGRASRHRIVHAAPISRAVFDCLLVSEMETLSWHKLIATVTSMTHLILIGTRAHHGRCGCVVGLLFRPQRQLSNLG